MDLIEFVRRNVLAICLTALCSLILVSPAVAGPCSADSDEAPGVYVPDEGCFALGVGYQYQHFNVFGTSFHNNDYTVNLTMHLFNLVYGANGRLTLGVEGALNAGFGGKTNGNPSLDAKSLFVGAGPHLAIPNRSRFEPWVHGLVGWQHFRFTQTDVLGSNSALGFIVGGGVDIRIAPRAYWRVEGDYVGTTFQSSIQSNYGFGTGLVLYF
jgi:hypothetical protein